MKAVLNLIIFILILGWAYGFIVMHASWLIHILLVGAAIVLLMRVTQK
ncbi:MAG: lmo0937 family membrane protein [Bacteroidetes bacterium]|nr:lmo0937 family membrane protein [Bacteroidota bacterium]MBS1755842.1 lmo0937 family membrane protein [Bacteroidota bacterium]